MYVKPALEECEVVVPSQDLANSRNLVIRLVIVVKGTRGQLNRNKSAILGFRERGILFLLFYLPLLILALDRLVPREVGIAGVCSHRCLVSGDKCFLFIPVVCWNT